MTSKAGADAAVDRWAEPGKHHAGRCYLCRFRREIPGDTHSRCAAPDNVEEPQSISVSFETHGVDHGWVHWPDNFDPIWLRFCDAFWKKK